jgi:ferric-dicitrate binding protein FerR (iron transport regulator)
MRKNDRSQQLIEGHFMGCNSKAESEELEGLLLASTSLRDDFREVAALDVLLRDEALAPDAVQPPTPIVQRKYLRVLAIAAAVVLACLAAVRWQAQPPDDQTVAVYPPPAPVVELQNVYSPIPMPGGDKIPDSVIMTIDKVVGTVMFSEQAAGPNQAPGTVVTVPYGDNRATFQTLDGSVFTLATGSVAVFARRDGQYHIDLVFGHLTADVRKQPPEHPMQLHMPNATATVRGTRFTLTASVANPRYEIKKKNQRPSTRLIVESGSVELQHTVTKETVTAGADEMALAEYGQLTLIDIAGLRVDNIVILTAEYHSETTRVDVAAALRNRVGSYRLIPIGRFNDVMGDPDPKKPKTLTITYTVDGKIGSASFKEWGLIEKMTKDGIIAREGRPSTFITLP